MYEGCGVWVLGFLIVIFFFLGELTSELERERKRKRKRKRKKRRGGKEAGDCLGGFDFVRMFEFGAFSRGKELAGRLSDMVRVRLGGMLSKEVLKNAIMWIYRV